MSGILVVGDSITAGQYCDPPHWPELIGAKAYGVSNDTTREGMQRLPGALDENPDADTVLLQFGHNDCNRWQTLNGYRRVPLAEFCSNLREMIALCCHRGARQVVLIRPHPTLLGAAYERDRKRYAEETLLDAWASMVAVCPEHLLDEIHLNAAGHKLYAEQVGAWLR